VVADRERLAVRQGQLAAARQQLTVRRHAHVGTWEARLPPR
jgi:hypothetical protein